MPNNIIEPSTNINVVYSTEYDYKYLLDNGIAKYGDLIIEASTGGHGVLHINDTNFYFAGAANYKHTPGNYVQEWEHDDIYLKRDELDSSLTPITNRILQITKTLTDISTYKYPSDNVNTVANTKLNDIKSVKDALNILLENLYYIKPVLTINSFVCHTSDTYNNTPVVINGEYTSIVYDWTINTNYGGSNPIYTTIFDKQSIPNNTYSASINISSTPSAFTHTLTVSSSWKDSHNNMPGTTSKSAGFSLYTEQYCIQIAYDITDVADITDKIKKGISDVISNSEIDFTSSTYIIENQSGVTNVKNDKVFSKKDMKFNHLYVFLYKPSSDTKLYLYDGDNNEVETNFINIGTINIAKNNLEDQHYYPVQYTIYKTEIKLNGTYYIKQKYVLPTSSSGGSGGGDLYWKES